MEEARLQQREANLTALAAIGPRKKRPLEQTESQVGPWGVPRTGTDVKTQLGRFFQIKRDEVSVQEMFSWR